MSRDPQLWVVAHALDSIFDVFGEDNCPVALYQTLGLPAVLRNAALTFNSRVWGIIFEWKADSHSMFDCPIPLLPNFVVLLKICFYILFLYFQTPPPPVDGVRT